MIRKITLLLSFVLILSLTACGNSDANTIVDTASPGDSPAVAESSGGGADGDVYTLVLATDAKDDHAYSVSAFEFARLCEEYSDGRLIIEVYNNGVLGTNEREMYESLQMGNYDMCVATTSPLVNFDNEYAIFDLPFLFRDKQHAYNVLDGEIGQAKTDSLLDKGILELAYWECGMFNFIYNGDPIVVPEDLKGRTIRCMETPVTMSWLASMGANPVPMAFGEVYTALQNGTVDGTILPYSTSYFQGIYEVCDYYSMLNITYCPLSLAIAKSSFDSLPADLQEVIQKAADESRDFNREYTRSVEQECLDEMAAGGCEIIEISDEDRQKWVEAIAELAYPNLIPSMFSEEEVAAIQAVA